MKNNRITDLTKKLEEIINKRKELLRLYRILIIEIINEEIKKR